MIEQTEMLVTEWHFHAQDDLINTEILTNFTTLQVMRKRAATKKGIACRLSCRFVQGEKPVLDYVGEHSYVIDFEDIIDKNELIKMLKNSFENFNEKFEFRKLGTVLHNHKLRPLDETNLDLDVIIPLLV